MAPTIQPPKKQLARLSAREMQGALPKLQRRINEINAIDPTHATSTYTPEFSAIIDNTNATLMEIFGTDSVEYERFKILSIYAGRNSYTREISRHEVIAGYTEGKKRSLIKIDSAIKWINEKLTDAHSMIDISSKEEEWISAASALAMLGMKHLPGTLAICKRAHAGLIRARAVRFVDDGRSADNVDVPAEFWWAKGEAALTQDWATGDFETWIDHRKHLQAFGVSFLRADIEKMIPSGLAKQSSAPNAPVAAKSGRSAIILTALDVETRAVLRHLTDVHEQTVRGTVFHVGQFEQWVVAVAECGEGNAHAAATTERGMAQFHPEVALFVGVAGGVKDVTIGDAVVSSKVYGYERGKDTEDGFKPRPTVNLPAYALEQRARAVRLKDDWQQRFDSALQHSKPTMIYIGAIAAGEKVVASSAGKIAQFLKENYGDTLGVEMEGQGFLEGVHINAPVQGCVIRGISDLLDGKADADKAGSKLRAADVASAVAFEMLATLEPDQAKRNGNVAASDGNPSNIGNNQDEEAMIVLLKAAGSHRFQINQQTMDGPTVKLGRQIYDAFILAGWIPNGTGPVPNFTSGIGGVMISGRTAKKNLGIVPILQSAFLRIGIDAAVDPSGNSHVSDDSIVEIFVAR